MNKYAIISLVVIFIVLIILKVNFFWLAVLAVAAAYFVRKHLQSVKQENTNEEIHKEVDKLDMPKEKTNSIEEEN
ncbi:hypothetical protein [Lentimicrobium sp. S6]|uniref:hypothetical protein n=1 Tax=Lentimicrobium sp. S6 TaxID=2735872 RepID=UPI001557A59A|nr:hypothetical protein [Lentimicrobium sp. S6]NPD45249.1 hypothetical protein [Lentimicrobium sp. S6]